MTRLVRSARSFALLVGLALAAPAAAQDAAAPAEGGEPAEALATIREMALYARYREARAAVQTYLAREDLDAAERNAGLEVLATLHIATREQRQATEVLAQLYARDPQHALSDPEASPPVLSAFGRARSRPPAQVAVELVHAPPTLEARTPPVLEVRVSGDGASAVQEISLRYRQGGDTELTTVVVQPDREGLGVARLPLLESSEAYEVTYLVEARAPSGAVLAARGTEAEPLTLAVPAASAVSVVGGGGGGGEPVTAAGGGEDLWWVGLIVALVVVGAGVVTTVLLVDELSGPQDGSLGNIELPLVRF